VLTCNTHGNALEYRKMADLIDATQPDIVAMQEWGWVVPNNLGAGRWYTWTDGELRLQSRYPLHRVEEVFVYSGAWNGGNGVGYEVQTPAGPLRLFNVHLASPHDALSSALRLETDATVAVDENAAQRLREAELLSQAAQRAGRNVIVCGDFNMPCDSGSFRRDLSRFRDAFSDAGWGFGWTYHHRGTATRIDHVLTGRGWNCQRCWVGPDVGSPHHPVIADLIWERS